MGYKIKIKKNNFFLIYINKTFNFGKIYKLFDIMNIPENLKYTKDHEWIRVEGDEAYVGITDFAAHELGDIVFVDVEVESEILDKEESFGSIEAVKTVSEMFMPVAGTVLEFNAILEDTPETINEDPYGEGWIIRMKIADSADLESLLSPEAYKELIG